ncbi:hypothetical protein [Pimelobacter simplex]|uniref:hypothetical protein n=1 Tax=Nocardioides simplex TaxID=2045 RepID=UPI0019344D8E|nr:hypothetical protein [Pimelobacter simplex]
MKDYSEFTAIEDYVTSLRAAAKREIENGERLLVSVKHCADMLSVSAWQVYRLLDQGYMTSVYLGRRRLVTIESLRKFVAGLPLEAP